MFSNLLFSNTFVSTSFSGTKLWLTNCDDTGDNHKRFHCLAWLCRLLSKQGMKLKICSNRLKYREQSWMVAFTLYCLQWGWLKICQVLIDKIHVLNFLIKFDWGWKWMSWYEKLNKNLCWLFWISWDQLNLFWTPLAGVECWSSLLSVVQSSRPARSAPALWAKHIHWLLYN